MNADAPGLAEKEPEGQPFGPKFLNMRIADGVSRLNFMTLLFGSFFGIAMMGFINASQPYLFEEVLKVPADEQGPLAGNLTFISELIVILSIGLIGAMSDKVGRKPLWAGAFVLLALGYFLYPMATSVDQLLLFRTVFALGLAANTAMLPSVANDYATEPSRGKVISVCFLLNGLGFILLLTPLRFLLPLFSDITDGDPVQTARYWMWTAGGICLFVSTGLLFGLKAGAPGQLEKREPVLATMKVLSTFFVLYLTQEGVAAGMGTDAASGYALKFYILIQVFALCWLPFMGFLLDRIDRVAGVAVAMTLAAAGYFSLYLIGDPLGPMMYVSAVIIGMGEISANLASLTLIGTEAPTKGRGAVIGMFSFFGAIGILIIAKVGGTLSGAYGSIAPFVLVACANVVVLVFALVVLAYTRRQSASEAAAVTAWRHSLVRVEIG